MTPVSNPVIDLIMQRTHDGSKPGQREDRYKLGLAIEGGAMRGVVTAGMVTALVLQRRIARKGNLRGGIERRHELHQS